MAELAREELKVGTRRCILVSVLEQWDKAGRERPFEEMQGLVETVGGTVVGTLVQVRDKPDTATFIGKGKVAELKEMVAELSADMICFDGNLSPSQGKTIEEETGKQVVDRSEIILDIFATHAQTHEARLQVELAQLLYMRPRLTRMWTHLERIEGGIGSGKGPGEKQLETDRRLVDRRIAELRRRLKEIESRREREVAGRSDYPSVSLVGYTNAGKSTLMNALTGAGVYVANQLFATLDTRTRKWTIPNFGDVLLSDTVGFIRNLPHHLVSSFRSTLEEARHADLLLHLVDATHPDALRHITTVLEVLKEVGVQDQEPILLLNKVDAAEDRTQIEILRSKFPNSITVSARSGTGLDLVAAKVSERLGDGFVKAHLETSVGNGKLFAFLAEHAVILKQEYVDNNTHIDCRIPRRFFSSLFDGHTQVSLSPSAPPPAKPLPIDDEDEMAETPDDV